MNRDLAILLGVLAFALAMAALYFGSLDTEPVPVAVAPTPAPTPTPRVVAPRATPVAVRARPRATPRPTLLPPAPTPAVEEEEAAADMTLRGQVVVDDGSAPGVCDVFVTVDGKRTQHKTDGDGAFRIDRPGGDVSIYGGRRFGSLHTRSPPVLLDTREGGEWEVTLVIEGGQTGGVGIGAKAHPLGIRVTTAFPGGPAAELGVVRGDVITEVDGVSTLGWSTTRFIQEMTGPVGSAQNFRVLHEDGTEENHEFERQVVQRPKRAPKAGNTQVPGTPGTSP